MKNLDESSAEEDRVADDNELACPRPPRKQSMTCINVSDSEEESESRTIENQEESKVRTSLS